MKILFVNIFIFAVYLNTALGTKETHSRKSGQSYLKSSQKNKIKSGATEHTLDKKSHRAKLEKRSLRAKDSNTMLMLDSSSGFQSAIQKDIEDLNNPSVSAESKRSIVAPENETIYYLKETDSDTDRSKPQKDTEELASSQKQITDMIMNQIRYIQAIEMEKQKYVCIVQNYQNCSQTPIVEPTINSTTQESADIDAINKPKPAPKEKEPTPIYSASPIVSQGSPVEKKPSSMICTDFSDWSPCSDVCVSGTSIRYRYCYDELGRVSYDKDTKACSDPACSYCSEWSPYSACDKMCGSGLKTKSRSCYLKNGTVFQDIAKDPCNFHPCQPKCGEWNPWTECSKPCDTGVKIRDRNCTLDDGSSKTFYEHRACNTQPCVKSVGSSSSRPYYEYPDEESCLSAHISFERFKLHVYSLFDNTLEQNDVHYKNMILFNGNLSCGISGVLTGKESEIRFYDDIFRNFDYSTLSSAFWILPIKSDESNSTIQTLFSFSSKKFDYGKYAMVLNQEYQPTLFYQTSKSFIVGKTDFAISPDVWHHVAVSFTDEDQNIVLYHNGIAIPLTITKMSLSEAPAGVFSEPGFQGFGNDATSATPFSGGIDEIYVHKCPLTKDQAAKIANTCRSRSKSYCPTPQHGLCHESVSYKNLAPVTEAPIVQQTYTPLNSVTEAH